jgi:hypothetical protein
MTSNSIPGSEMTGYRYKESIHITQYIVHTTQYTTHSTQHTRSTHSWYKSDSVLALTCRYSGGGGRDSRVAALHGVRSCVNGGDGNSELHTPNVVYMPRQRRGGKNICGWE